MFFLLFQCFSITGPSVKQSGELGRKVVTISSAAATTKSATIACYSFLDLHFPPPYLQNVLLTKQEEGAIFCPEGV